MTTKNFTISSIASVIAEISTLPICTIKTIYQTNLTHKSLYEVAKNIYLTRGLWGFYNSSIIAILSQTISTATKFTGYTYLKNYRHSQQHNLFSNMLNGTIAGMISTIFVHPIDVVKVHKQNNFNFMQELKSVGPKLFYRGYTKSLFKNMILTSIIFPFYDFYKYYFCNIYVATILASITATIILHPIDYLKIRHISGQELYPKNSGIKYFYRGFHINLMRTMPHFMITMVFIEHMNKLI